MRRPGDASAAGGVPEAAVTFPDHLVPPGDWQHWPQQSIGSSAGDGAPRHRGTTDVDGWWSISIWTSPPGGVHVLAELEG